MAEEDQESHFDDHEEQEPMKVSVTFKPPEPENDDAKLIETSENQTPDAISTPEDPGQADDTRDSDTEELHLPINPPVTPILSCVVPEKVNNECLNTEQPDVLEVNVEFIWCSNSPGNTPTTFGWGLLCKMNCETLERKEDGKPCVTSVTIILFEITFRKNSLSFKQIFL